MAILHDVSPYVARELARLYPDRWTYDNDRCEFASRIVPQRDGGASSPGLCVPPIGQSGLEMPRITYETVTFRRPFALSGWDALAPAGNYTVETEDALLDTLSVVAYRRTSTTIHIKTGPGVFQAIALTQDELDRALAQDAVA